MTAFETRYFPCSRIATSDICTVGLKKHHVAALLEIDVTAGRQMIRQLRKEGQRLFFIAWLVSVISRTVKDHGFVAAFKAGKINIIFL